MGDADDWLAHAQVPVTLTPAEWALVTGSLLASVQAGYHVPTMMRVCQRITAAIGVSAPR